MRAKIFGAWLYSFEIESWIVSQEKNPCWIFSDFSRSSTWFKSKTAHFYLKLNALNMLSALRLTEAYLTSWAFSDWMRHECIALTM